MKDSTYFMLGMLINHFWKIVLVVILLLFLFACGPTDCPPLEKIEEECPNWTPEQEAQFQASIDEECSREWFLCAE